MPRCHRAGEDPTDWTQQFTLPPCPHPLVAILPKEFESVDGFVGPFENKYLYDHPISTGAKSDTQLAAAAEEGLTLDDCYGITWAPDKQQYELRGNKYKPSKWKLSPNSVLCIPAEYTGELSWIRTTGGELFKPRESTGAISHPHPRKASVIISKLRKASYKTKYGKWPETITHVDRAYRWYISIS